ncbi:MAG: hypothetical protein GXY89_04365 [Tissierellia bacterium]|jgi:hypothetical protein|nr:hypothetical protein [Tissierellia bacterium]
MNKKDYYLSNEKTGSFVKVRDNNSIFYGGNQQWYKNKRRVVNGCGPVAGANILAYLSNKDDKYANLYNEENFSKENFVKFQESIYDLIKPSPLGLININHFIKRIIQYGISKGVDLSYKKLGFNDRNFTYLSSYTFIRNALMKDIPVVVFNLDLRRDFLFRWHWMVITRIYAEDGEIKLVLSSWGKRYVIDFDRLFSSMRMGGGMVYFY